MSKKEKIIPLSPLPIIETHFHLDYLKAHPNEEIVRKSREYNIEKMITISVDPDNFDAVMELTKKFPEVYGTQGIHPQFANSEQLSEITASEATKWEKVVKSANIKVD